MIPLNETIMQMGSQSEIFMEIHTAIVMPTVLILYTFLSLIFLSVGLLMIDTSKSSYSKFLKIFFISQIIMIAFVVIPILFLPLTVQNAIGAIVSAFTFG